MPETLGHPETWGHRELNPVGTRAQPGDAGRSTREHWELIPEAPECKVGCQELNLMVPKAQPGGARSLTWGR